MVVGLVLVMVGWWKEKEILMRINVVEVVEIRCEFEFFNCVVDVVFDMIGFVGNVVVFENSYVVF